MHAAATEAAKIIQVALALAQNRTAALRSMGFINRRMALLYALKRRRGLVGAYVGPSVKELLEPKRSKLQGALRLIIDGGVPVNIAVRMTHRHQDEQEHNLRAVRRLLKQARADAQATVDRQQNFQARTTVTDIDDYSPKTSTP
jgi:hypothetical protein